MTPEEFAEYAAIGAAKGFLLVSSSPLTRSSHHAGDDFARLKAARSARGTAIPPLTVPRRRCSTSRLRAQGERVAQ